MNHFSAARFHQVACLTVFLAGCGVPNPVNSTLPDKVGNAADLLVLPADMQAGTYRNIDKIFNTRTFSRGTTVYPLPNSPMPLTSVKYSPDGKNTYGIEEYLKRNNVAGLLIIKEGKIVLERYAQGNTETTKWTSFSVGKSITSTLVGAAVQDGTIKDIQALVTDYLPQMKGTAYEGVTIKHLLQMSSGVKWNEDYRDPNSDLSALFKCLVDGKTGGCILSVLSKVKTYAPPGKAFHYSTGEAHLEGEVLAAALGGESLSSYLSRKIWANVGMESDGYWMLESKDGQEFAGGCLSMVLRDYGRFGQFILDNGVAGGKPVLPPDWLAMASAPAPGESQVANGNLYTVANGYGPLSYQYPQGYGFNWWTLPEGTWGPWDYLNEPTVWGTNTIAAPAGFNFANLSGSFVAPGIFGQMIHINPKEKMVTVVWSIWRDPWIDPKEYETYSFLNAVTEVLKK